MAIYAKTGSGVLWQTGQAHPRPKMQGIVRIDLTDNYLRKVLKEALSQGKDELVLEISCWKTAKAIGKTGKKGYSLSLGEEAKLLNKSKKEEEVSEPVEIPEEIVL